MYVVIYETWYVAKLFSLPYRSTVLTVTDVSIIMRGALNRFTLTLLKVLVYRHPSIRVHVLHSHSLYVDR